MYKSQLQRGWEAVMTLPRLSNLEMRIMEILWSDGGSTSREIQEKFPAKNRPAYTTIQTMVQRLEAKKAVRRVKKNSTALVFEATVPRDAARRRLIDDFLNVFGGEPKPIMTHLIEVGKLTLEDVQDAEKLIQELSRKKRKIKKDKS
jgi:BlaI family transcriptional regulator, penicillinase repressor